MSESSVTCPECRRTSYNANDVREGYCGACHWWTSPSVRELAEMLAADPENELVENAIIERIGLDPDETEQGLTPAAVHRIEAFVSERLRREWSYGLVR